MSAGAGDYAEEAPAQRLESEFSLLSAVAATATRRRPMRGAMLTLHSEESSAACGSS